MNSQRLEDLLKAVEQHHEQYVKNLRLLFETQAASTRTTRLGSIDVNGSPLLRAATFGSAPAERSRRLTNESPKIHPVSVFDDHVEEHAEFLPLTPSRATSAKSTNEVLISSVTKPICQESFKEEDLIAHLYSISETNQDTITALGDVWQRRSDLDASNLLTSFETGDGSCYESATYDFYEVGKDSVPKPKQIQAEQTYFTGGDGDGDNQDASVWRVLKDVNSDGNAVGRMT